VIHHVADITNLHFKYKNYKLFKYINHAFTFNLIHLETKHALIPFMLLLWMEVSTMMVTVIGSIISWILSA